MTARVLAVLRHRSLRRPFVSLGLEKRMRRLALRRGAPRAGDQLETYSREPSAMSPRRCAPFDRTAPSRGVDREEDSCLSPIYVPGPASVSVTATLIAAVVAVATMMAAPSLTVSRTAAAVSLVVSVAVTITCIVTAAGALVASSAAAGSPAAFIRSPVAAAGSVSAIRRIAAVIAAACRTARSFASAVRSPAGTVASPGIRTAAALLPHTRRAGRSVGRRGSPEAVGGRSRCGAVASSRF